LSADGGITWVVSETSWNGSFANPDATTYARLRTVQANDENLVYAAGEDEDATRVTGDIETDAVFLKSTDGGVSWSKQYAEGLKVISDVKFLDENIGFALGRPNEMPADQRIWLFRTEDGGDNWIPVVLAFDRLAKEEFVEHPGIISQIVEVPGTDEYSMLTLEPSSEDWVEHSLPGYVRNSLQFVTRDFGLAVTDEGLWITTNGGANWTLEEQELINSRTLVYAADEEHWLAINRVVVIEPELGIGREVTLHYEVSETNDGGANWKTRTVTKDCEYVNPFGGLVFRTPDNRFLSVGSQANMIWLNN
jgi:photosystem II stability/assembly factor-like uncharacterized protein